MFNSPDINGGGSVISGSAIEYAKDVYENHISSDHIMIQFVGDSEFYTNRVAVQVWRSLSGDNKSSLRSGYSIIDKSIHWISTSMTSGVG